MMYITRLRRVFPPFCAACLILNTDTRPQLSWSWMRSCYSNVTSFPITADKSNYVVGSMTVTNQLLDHLPDLFLCSQITPRLIKQNSSTVGGISQGSITFVMVRARWECISTSALTECCLQAHDWTFWEIICTFDPSHLQLIHITWTNRSSWGSDICVQAQQCVSATVSWLFLATLTSSSISGLQVLVKLVPRSHSQVSSKYGYTEVDSAPTAYVMEHLDPSTWQTLYPFDSTKAKVVDPKLRTTLNTIT